MLFTIGKFPDAVDNCYIPVIGEKAKCVNDVLDELMSNTILAQPTKKFIEPLFKVDAQTRPSFSRILKHEWFNGIDQKKIVEKKLIAPWIPINAYSNDKKILFENIYSVPGSQSKCIHILLSNYYR